MKFLGCCVLPDKKLYGNCLIRAEYTALKFFLPYPQKQNLPRKFSLYWNIFDHSGFLSNLRLPWKQSLPWNFSRQGVRPTPASYAYVHIKHERPQVLSRDPHVTIDTIDQTQDAANVLRVLRHYSRHAAWSTVILIFMETRWKTLALSLRSLIRWIKVNFINNYKVNCWRIFIELIIHRQLSLCAPLAQFAACPLGLWRSRLKPIWLTRSFTQTLINAGYSSSNICKMANTLRCYVTSSPLLKITLHLNTVCKNAQKCQRVCFIFVKLTTSIQDIEPSSAGNSSHRRVPGTRWETETTRCCVWRKQNLIQCSDRTWCS